MERSLSRLAVAESTFHARRGIYTAVMESLRVNGAPFEPEDDVRLIIVRADSAGWRAIASNAWTDEVCRLAGAAPGRTPEQRRSSASDCR